MKYGKRIFAICLGLVFLFSFPGLASSNNNLSDSEDCIEIYNLESEILEIVNYGYPRGEINSNEVVKVVDFDNAYKVYSNANLFDSKSFDKETLMSMLEEGNYIWQLPVFVGENTILFDIVKLTKLPDNVSEEIKRELTPQLNKWMLGATYIYSDRIVDYKQNVEISLEMSGLNPEEYTCAFVSGLPEIKFPVAVIFGEDAEFIIPAEEAAAHVFGSEAEELAYQNQIASASNVYTDRNLGGFTVYEFEKVAEMTDSDLLEIGAGGIQGINEKTGLKNPKTEVVLAILSTCILVCIILKVRKCRKK